MILAVPVGGLARRRVNERVLRESHCFGECPEPGKKEINEILHSSFWVCVFSFHNGRGWLMVAREFFEIQD